MKLQFCSLLLAAAAFTASAQADDSKLLNINGALRFDYEHKSIDGTTDDSASGMKGKYFLLRVDGNITDNISYSWRQRLNSSTFDSSFFDSTDWIYMNANLGNWSLAAGKQVVQIGGYEYDRNPIDVFLPSVFWNSVAPFQIGASVGYHFTPSDQVVVQANQSPFFTKENRNMYAYSAIWLGNHGWFNSMWSVNVMEYAKGKYISYICLGNKFNFDKIQLELDLMNRASDHQTYLFRDASVMANLLYSPTNRWTVFGKFTYDVNNTHSNGDLVVLSGTEMKMAGAGVEFYPLVNHKSSLRLHALCGYAWGKNANPGDVFQNKTLMIDCGVSFKMDFFSLKRK